MRHRWNKTDDRTIARYIVLYDTPQAFRKYSEDFGVTEKSVASRYYRRRAYIKFVIDEILPSPLELYKHSHKTSWFRRLWESVKNMLGISKN